MDGLHLTADLHACRADAAAMRDVDALRRLCLGAVQDAGLQPVAQVFHVFPEAAGVTGVVLLAESHLAVHTWPELDAVTLDVYVCNYGQDNSAKAQRLLDSLLATFAPARVERHALKRGGVAT